MKYELEKAGNDEKEYERARSVIREIKQNMDINALAKEVQKLTWEKENLKGIVWGKSGKKHQFFLLLILIRDIIKNQNL